MTGYIRINRGVFRHRVFKIEPYSEILAWIDLISRASYKEDIIRFNQYTKKVKRGELVVSPKYLALKWNWNVSKVRRFLKRLAFASMIGIVTNEGISRITIVNYNEYQHTTTLQANLQAKLRSKSDHILNNKINNKYIYVQSFKDFWDNIPSNMKKGKGAAAKAFKNIKTELKVDELARRYRKSFSINKQYTKHPATWLNHQCWEDDEVQGPQFTTITAQQFVDGYKFVGTFGEYDEFTKYGKKYKKHRFKKDAKMELDS
jgi:hypothetical protein